MPNWKSRLWVYCDGLLSALALSYQNSCQATMLFQSISLRRLSKCLRRSSISLRETSVDLRGPCAGRLGLQSVGPFSLQMVLICMSRCKSEMIFRDHSESSEGPPFEPL